MNRLAQEAAIYHVGVGCDDLKDKNQCENESVLSRSEKARQRIPAGSTWKPWPESKSHRKTRRTRSNQRSCLLARQDGARKAQENRRSASSSKRRRGSGASACCFEKRRRARKSSSCAGRQRQTVYRAMSCASSITSAHRAPQRSSRNTESSWKTWLPWNLPSSRTLVAAHTPHSRNCALPAVVNSWKS